jgi:signal transduction histidine kinase
MSASSFPLDRKHLAASWRSWTSNDLQRVGPIWLQWVWTTIFCATLAVFFTILGAVSFSDGNPWRWASLPYWALWYGKNFVVCFTIGGLIHVLFDLSRVLMGGPERLRRMKPWQRSVFFAGIPMLGVVIGWPVGVMLSGSAELLPNLLQSPRALGSTIVLALGISLALHFYFAALARQAHAEQQATEAQLRLLQAQIEPHFLFNTLANVHALIEFEPAQAKAMLGAFTDYLRASLSTLRRDAVPLAEELALAEAYLRVQQARMAGRLRYRIEADEAARQMPLPPLLLQPLVENAVLHGVEPQLDGGTVTVRARLEGGRLVLQVQDDGPGPDAPRRHAGGGAGNGIALANVRERLLQRHGDAASLIVARAPTAGTVATLTLPADAAAGRRDTASAPPAPTR